MKTKPLTIGVLARTANVNIETVRYYQRIGLINEPEKPAQGYRVYPESTLKRIQFIKRAQQLGFSLQEVTELLSLGDAKCADVRQIAEQKYQQITNQIKDLTNLKDNLGQLIESCQSDSTDQHCAIVETLSNS